MSRRTRKPNQFEILHQSDHTQREAAIARENRLYLRTILCGLGRIVIKADPTYRFRDLGPTQEPSVAFCCPDESKEKTFKLSYERSDDTTAIYHLKCITPEGKEVPNGPLTLVPMEDDNLSPRTIEEMARVMAKALGVDLTAKAKQPASPAETMVVAGGSVAYAPHP